MNYYYYYNYEVPSITSDISTHSHKQLYTFGVYIFYSVFKFQSFEPFYVILSERTSDLLI